CHVHENPPLRCRGVADHSIVSANNWSVKDADSRCRRPPGPGSPVLTGFAALSPGNDGGLPGHAVVRAQRWGESAPTKGQADLRPTYSAEELAGGGAV